MPNYFDDIFIPEQPFISYFDGTSNVFDDKIMSVLASRRCSSMFIVSPFELRNYSVHLTRPPQLNIVPEKASAGRLGLMVLSVLTSFEKPGTLGLIQ